MSKKLDEELNNFEQEIEIIKNSEFKLFGIKVTAVSLGAAFALISSLIGGLYGVFMVYNDYMNMKEQISAYQAPDISGVEKRAELAEQKAVDSVDYTRDIKSSLQDDIVNTEDRVDRLDQKIARSEELLSRQQDKLKNMIDNADERFENQRARLQADNKRELRDLEERLNRKIQQALDNPLSR